MTRREMFNVLYASGIMNYVSATPKVFYAGKAMIARGGYVPDQHKTNIQQHNHIELHIGMNDNGSPLKIVTYHYANSTPQKFMDFLKGLIDECD